MENFVFEANTIASVPTALAFPKDVSNENAKIDIINNLHPEDIKTGILIPLVSEHHIMLRTKLERFDFDNPPTDPIKLSENLLWNCIQYHGMALSANQLGLPYRVFVINCDPPIAMFNPTIVDRSVGGSIQDEGCLSYPHLYLNIERPDTIKIRFQNAEGTFFNEKFVGLTAKVCQHEWEHCEGILFIDKVSKLNLDIARRKQRKTEKLLKLHK